MLLRFIASKVIHALISSGLLGLVVAVMVMLHVRLYFTFSERWQRADSSRNERGIVQCLTPQKYKYRKRLLVISSHM